MGVPNLFARHGHAAFYRELATSPRYRSLVHLSRLDVGTTWAALNLGLTFRDCYYPFLASYDDGEVSRFGPGAAHLRELLRYAIERGLKRFDFTIGDEPYKRDWCETEQQLFDYSAAATLRGWPVGRDDVRLGRAKRAIKQTAPLWNAVQRLRAAAAVTAQEAGAAAKERRLGYFRNSGEIRPGRNSDTFGHTITSASTISIGTSMMPVSLMASRMRMPATEQAIIRHSP